MSSQEFWPGEVVFIKEDRVEVRVDWVRPFRLAEGFQVGCTEVNGLMDTSNQTIYRLHEDSLTRLLD